MSESLSEAFADDEIGRLAADLAAVRGERDQWRRRHDTIAKELGHAEQALSLLGTAGAVKPPKWLAPPRSRKTHRATVTAILSDCHFDEVVRPAEVGNINAYNRAIAELRLKRWARNVIEQSRDYLTGVQVDGLVLMLAGDNFSGNLHDLSETNEDTTLGSLEHWTGQLAAAINLLADHFGEVHIAAVVGNHGRQTHKPRTKLRARDNLDWKLALDLAKVCRQDGVTFAIGEDADAWIDVYDTTYLLTHGDQTTGGGGIGGVWPPIMRMLARKRQRYGRDFIACMGHYHQLIMAPGQGLVVNGSLKGYDEYAAVMLNAPPEIPQQAMWITTPEHGPTWQAPIFVQDRKAEGW